MPPTLIPGTINYSATTYSAGATYRGHRMADRAESAPRAAFARRPPPSSAPTSRSRRSAPRSSAIPSLQPETSQQLEVGATFDWGGGRLDLALFQNVIHNRIQPVTLSSVGGVVVQQSQNNAGNLVVQGLEFQAEADVIRTLKLDSRAVLATGTCSATATTTSR